MTTIARHSTRSYFLSLAMSGLTLCLEYQHDGISPTTWRFSPKVIALDQSLLILLWIVYSILFSIVKKNSWTLKAKILRHFYFGVLVFLHPSKDGAVISTLEHFVGL